MKRKISIFCSVFTLLAALYVFSLAAQAQTFRYIDESGNIHFVEKLEHVPLKYRDQVVSPTPIPTYPKGYKPPKPTNTPKPRPTKKAKPVKQKVAPKRAPRGAVGLRRNTVVEAPPLQPGQIAPPPPLTLPSQK